MVLLAEKGILSPLEIRSEMKQFFSSSSVSCYSRQRCGIKTLLLLGGRRLVAQASGILSSRVRHTLLYRDERNIFYSCLMHRMHLVKQFQPWSARPCSQDAASVTCSLSSPRASIRLPFQNACHVFFFFLFLLPFKKVLCCLQHKVLIIYGLFQLHISTFSHTHQIFASNNYSLFLNSIPTHWTHLCLERPQQLLFSLPTKSSLQRDFFQLMVSRWKGYGGQSGSCPQQWEN